MTALFFVCLVACIFVGVAIAESQDGATRSLRLGPGLIGWVVSGNWPAKVGGGLLIIGVGALMRYALLHVDVAPPMKLASGVACSAALLAAAHIVRSRFGRREIAIALTGAAFGVAYLTAYSAYALFHYLQSFAGLAFLSAIALGAGVYAVWRNAVSLAMLSMFGAFLAPAFALEQPSAGVVYGYYLVISQLVLMAVAIRGWRPLIHLSFLFTLGGGVFFAWTSEFYRPEHFGVMLPMLLALAAVHVAMPMMEQRSPMSRWMQRMDWGYFLLLPIVSAASLAVIAPTVRLESAALMMLGGIWLVAAASMRLLKQPGAARHALVGALLIFVGLYVRMPEWPWFLIGQAISVGALLIAYRNHWTRSWQNVAVGGLLFFTAMFAAGTLIDRASGTPFLNQVVLERLTAGALLIAAGSLCRRLEHPLAALLGILGAIGLIDTVALELYRWDIATWSLIVHGALVALGFTAAYAASRRALAKSWLVILAGAIALTAWWATTDANAGFALSMLVLAPLSLIALSLRSHAHEADDAHGNRALALILAPVTACVWAAELGDWLRIDADQFALAIGTAIAIAAIAAARWMRARSESWLEPVLQIFGIAFGALLALFTVFHIQRGVWPMTLDVLCLIGLWQLTVIAKREDRPANALYTVSTLGAALVVQAMLLRLLGPQGTMTVADVFDLQWPAVISLFWSSLGAALTLVARNIRSRTLWSAGAVVLVACAVKLVLFDFGSLGQLANILAVIAAGLVFMLVSWLAPLPPKEGDEPSTTTEKA